MQVLLVNSVELTQLVYLNLPSLTFIISIIYNASSYDYFIILVAASSIIVQNVKLFICFARFIPIGDLTDKNAKDRGAR